MAEGLTHLTTFIEGMLVHGQADPRVLLVPCPHAPHRGLLMPPQVPWAPGFLPYTLLQALIRDGYKIPFRVVDPTKLPVVFDERTSRMPTPWCLRLENLEGQQRLFLTHLLRATAPEAEPPTPPMGGRWVNEAEMEPLDLIPGVKRLCQAAIQGVKG